VSRTLISICVVVAAVAALPVSTAAETPIDYGVRVIAPVDANGVPTHAHAVVGVPFRLAVELFANRAAGSASVAYDMFLPTDMVIPLRAARMRSGHETSRCLANCTVGWDTGKTLRTHVYYVMIPPGPGSFIVAARLVSTDRRDARRGDNTATLTIAVDAPRLTLGVPQLEDGGPVAGRRFTVVVPVRRSGVSVTPTSARCLATVGIYRLEGEASRSRGRVRCTWSIPTGTAGGVLETTVSASLRSLRAAGALRYIVRRAG
jgi:hypothetical protein